MGAVGDVGTCVGIRKANKTDGRRGSSFSRPKPTVLPSGGQRPWGCYREEPGPRYAHLLVLPFPVAVFTNWRSNDFPAGERLLTEAQETPEGPRSAQATGANSSKGAEWAQGAQSAGCRYGRGWPGTCPLPTGPMRRRASPLGRLVSASGHFFFVPWGETGQKTTPAGLVSEATKLYLIPPPKH